MQLFHGTNEVPSDFGPSAVSIGKFDGLHSGHRAVLSQLMSIADARSLVSTVVTFDRHPLALLHPELCPAPLVSSAQKTELLASAGVDAMLMLAFDRELSGLPAGEFVRSIIVDALHASCVLVGRDFRFGAGGVGTVALLSELGETHGFEVIIIEDVARDGDRRVSSTWIRELISSGRVAEAKQLLGGPPRIRSVVVHGEQRGRTLGYPTANLSPEIEGLIPANGVYAAYLLVGDGRYPAAVSIGNNPTFEGVPDQQVEAHAIDQNLDLYGQTVSIEFVEFVRGMTKFANAAELAAQMGADEVRIREILGVAPRSIAPASGESS
ncbi:MAG: bifunctional riboflavin kinase/FAD synthetase [Salinibacterium sp.]|nr:bifunctional riboflavin kinase/FAD synthetase [Salinibacterium sp.]